MYKKTSCFYDGYCFMYTVKTLKFLIINVSQWTILDLYSPKYK